jgi:HJR/Mrr/RecB family endonuclease
MKRKVFISYSQEDKEFVEWLIRHLSDLNIDIWYDNNELRLGDSIKSRISEGIQSSSIFIVVLSNSSKSSAWVNYELNSALILSAMKKGVRIIPLKIDDSELPSDLSGFLYADFYTEKQRALKLLKEILLKPIDDSFEFSDWEEFDWRKFERLVFDLLTSEGFKVSRTPKTRDGGYDFIAQIRSALGNDEKIIVETKFYRNQKISIDILRQLYGISIAENYNKVLLITNSELTRASRDFLSHSPTNILVWEGHELIDRILSHPSVAREYFKIRKPAQSESLKIVDSELLETQTFIKRLNECSPGIEGWKEYENTCIDILNYLFVPPLGAPKIQSRRESGVDIRDAIFPNRNKNENWRFIREDYDAKYIVFEFKNYSDGGSDIDKQSVLQINDYLKKTIGRFGIICSRKDPNQSGLEKRKDVFIENSKLVLFMSNDQLREMLLRKHKKMDPSDVIIDMIDDFNLKF